MSPQALGNESNRVKIGITIRCTRSVEQRFFIGMSQFKVDRILQTLVSPHRRVIIVAMQGRGSMGIVNKFKQEFADIKSVVNDDLPVTLDKRRDKWIDAIPYWEINIDWSLKE